MHEPCLPYANVRERIVFDLVKRIDTVAPGGEGTLPRERAQPHPRAALLQFVDKRNEARFRRIAIGCCELKSQIVCEQLIAKAGRKLRVYGIDDSHRLLEQARHNQCWILRRGRNLVPADASEVDYGARGSRLVVHLYDPFHGAIPEMFATALEGCDAGAIHNNPEPEPVLLDHGFAVAAQKIVYHPEAGTKLYRRDARTGSRAA